ncbi:hypothetical protein [Clostridium hydrogenum]|uniref:hypothetical protein n=1 Tax=Clostridium hydrogenum TaxID=2855764 RepID=UPI001F23F9C7|nr:hypothetical protein [Clostridium hydrogenum]
MKNFTFYNPTKVEFGKDKENLIGNYMTPYSTKKVLLLLVYHHIHMSLSKNRRTK